MGKGIDIARGDAPLHAAVLDDFKDQLLIVLIKRLGGVIDVPIAEADDTGQDVLAMSVDLEKKIFHFEAKKKS